MGDIGQHFPDTSAEYEGVYSIELLRSVTELMLKENYKVANVDATLILQKPKVMSFLPEMRDKLSKALGVDVKLVSVKATTTEKLGITGRGEAVAAQAVCLLTQS